MTDEPSTALTIVTENLPATKLSPGLAALKAKKLTKPIKYTNMKSASPKSSPVTPSGSHISHGSTGNLAPVVDKVVGSSYDVVREVAYNLEYIKHVSAHLEQVYMVAKAITEGGSLILSPAEVANPGNPGEMVFELTSNELLTIKVMGSDSIIRRAEIVLI